MNQPGTISRIFTVSSPLAQFITKEKNSRIYGYIALVAITVQFVIFKIMYPFPDFLPESYNYIDTASQHLAANVWPVGYGKFLWLVHLISHSDTFLIGIQYFLLEAAMAYLFYTILYLYRPARASRNTIFVFLFINPFLLYLSNCILPDALFGALSIVFFVQFCWMFHRPVLTQVLIQGGIIGMAFTLSFAAIYYPLVSVAGLLLLKRKTLTSSLGWIIGIVLMITFALYTIQKTKQTTGSAQYSILGGWQLANNALYMYDHIKVDSASLPKETRALDREAKQFFQDIPPIQRELASFGGAFFLIVPYSPLKQFMNRQYKEEDAPAQFDAWAKVAPLYATYGKALMHQHPVPFLKYFLGPNIKNYFLPPLEKFDIYNLNMSDVPTNVQDWFDYVTPDIAVISATFQAKLFYPYRFIFLTLNLYFWGCLAWFLFTGKIKKMRPDFRRTLLLASCFLLFHFGFSVVATPVVLRFQVVPIILLLSFSLFLGHPKNEYA